VEVEFSGNQEDHRPDRCESNEATCTALGCLEQSIDPKSGSYPVAGSASAGLKGPSVDAILSLT
jgi:hypothetical protein